MQQSCAGVDREQISAPMSRTLAGTGASARCGWVWLMALFLSVVCSGTLQYVTIQFYSHVGFSANKDELKRSFSVSFECSVH
jgi:hypothetical protein